MLRAHHFLLLAMALVFAACGRQGPVPIQGYIEGEYVYVASPLAGALQKLSVRRGDRVLAGQPLFALEAVPEQTARDEAQRRLLQAQANLADLRKGRRPEEIAAIEAQLAQARAALGLAEKEKARQQELLATGAAARQEMDRALSSWQQDQQRVAQLQADLETARLGARKDQVEAAEADVRAREAALARADWDLTQKSQAAPQSALVFDTLYREGEWVAAGRPVVALLPPENVKVRAFVPEERLSQVRAGGNVRVRVDGVAEPFSARITYISPQAEYTPPVIYSRETRGKLVFMVEAFFAPEAAARLNPGQPVEVELAP